MPTAIQMFDLCLQGAGAGGIPQKIALKLPAEAAGDAAAANGFAEVMNALLALPAERLADSLKKLAWVPAADDNKVLVPIIDLSRPDEAGLEMVAQLLAAAGQADDAVLTPVDTFEKGLDRPTADAAVFVQEEALPQSVRFDSVEEPSPPGRFTPPEESSAPGRFTPMAEKGLPAAAEVKEVGQEGAVKRPPTRPVAALPGTTDKAPVDETAQSVLKSPAPAAAAKTVVSRPVTAAAELPADEVKDDLTWSGVQKPQPQNEAPPHTGEKASSRRTAADVITDQRPPAPLVAEQRMAAAPDRNLSSVSGDLSSAAIRRVLPDGDNPQTDLTKEHEKRSDLPAAPGRSAPAAADRAAPAFAARPEGLPFKETADDIMRQIVARMRLSSDRLQSQMHIRLKPEFLGDVRMQITTVNQQVMVRIAAESQAVKEMIEQHVASLRNELQQHGLQIDKLDVFVGHDDGAFRRRRRSTGGDQHPVARRARRAAAEDNPVARVGDAHAAATIIQKGRGAVDFFA